MAIITITRQLGSSGTEIAERLRDELGFNYLDRALLEEKLINTCQLPEKDVERYDEKKPAFWESFSADKDRYLHCIKTVIYEFAHQGHCIIIGRGGQALFRDMSGVLHVNVIAPINLRRERVQARLNYDTQLAEQAIQLSDHDRAGFHKYFFQINWEDPNLYHLIISTDIFNVDAAVQLIKDAINVSGIFNDLPQENSTLANLCLTQAVITKIKYTEHIPIEFLNVVAAGGAAILRGAAVREEDIKRCEIAARNVPGVEKVINEMRYIRNPYKRYDRRVEPLS
jgi:cytidylate kinase